MFLKAILDEKEFAKILSTIRRKKKLFKNPEFDVTEHIAKGVIYRGRFRRPIKEGQVYFEVIIRCGDE
jgi:hypothetical protein